MTLSTYAANKLADHVDGRTSFTLPTGFVALYTASPGVGGSAVTNEVAYTTYARVACGTGGSSIFPAAGSGTTSQTATLNFAIVTSGGPVTITHVALVDSASGAGNLLIFGALTTPVTFNNGQTPSFSAAQLTETFT